MFTNILFNCFLVELLRSFGDYLCMIHINQQNITYIITHTWFSAAKQYTVYVLCMTLFESLIRCVITKNDLVSQFNGETFQFMDYYSP